jgi:glycosyltransferase involved in cell wall biosynthesis
VAEPVSVSVVVPCRNEQGHIAEIVERLPEFGTSLEVVWVEGNSTDDTRGEIERQIAAHPERDMRLVVQPGRGKADAVRTGFSAARNELLMILDGDVSVLPEDLPKFYRAATERRGELVNGTRLIYDVEPGAMRFLNLLGNRAFSYLLTAITGQHLTDTLCGTKVLRREDYDEIVANRAYFGEFDPFGDFDLLLGAARLGHRIVDVPVRYHPRVYGATNISRWRHGWLLARMTAFAFWKFRVAPVRG